MLITSLRTTSTAPMGIKYNSKNELPPTTEPIPPQKPALSAANYRAALPNFKGAELLPLNGAVRELERILHMVNTYRDLRDVSSFIERYANNGSIHPILVRHNIDPLDIKAIDKIFNGQIHTPESVIAVETIASTATNPHMPLEIRNRVARLIFKLTDEKFQPHLPNLIQSILTDPQLEINKRALSIKRLISIIPEGEERRKLMLDIAKIGNFHANNAIIGLASEADHKALATTPTDEEANMLRFYRTLLKTITANEQPLKPSQP